MDKIKLLEDLLNMQPFSYAVAVKTVTFYETRLESFLKWKCTDDYKKALVVISEQGCLFFVCGKDMDRCINDFSYLEKSIKEGVSEAAKLIYNEFRIKKNNCIVVEDDMDQIVKALSMIMPVVEQKSILDGYRWLKVSELIDDYGNKAKEERYKIEFDPEKCGESVLARYEELSDYWKNASSMQKTNLTREEYEKVRNEYIEQDDRVTRYVTKCVVEEVEKQKKEIEKAGKEGETRARYALKWLDKSFRVLMGESEKLYIFNQNYIDEKLKYDAIVVGPKGVFNIEIKNYVGKVSIDEAGNWTRGSGDEVIGMKNPLQQVRIHEKLLRSILPNDVEISSIICIANDICVLNGTQNSSIPVVK